MSDEKIIKMIKEILNRGNDCEIKKNREGQITVYEKKIKRVG